MDYIIFGLGSGATLTLAGWSLREWGSAIRDRSSSSAETVLSGYELVNQMGWQRFCRSCGAVLAMFGLLVLLATIISTALMLSDATGSMIVISTFMACLVATLIWLGLFLHRFGARGILRPKATQPSVPVAVDERAVDTAAMPESPAPLVGPPVPSGSSSEGLDPDRAASDETSEELVASSPDRDLVQDEVTVEEPAPQEAEDRSEVQPVETRSEAGGGGLEPPVEEEHPADKDEPVDTGKAVDAADSPADEPQPVAASPVPNDDESIQQSRDDSDAHTGAPSDAAVATGDLDVSSRDELPQAPVTSPEHDDTVDGEAHGDIEPPPSGRADAVRSLRQRRIKRLMRDSSEPD